MQAPDRRAADAAYYQRNRERIIERVRAYRAANPEAVKERKRVYYERNGKAIRSAVRAYAQANHEAVLALRRRRYRSKHAEERAQQRAYRAAHVEEVRLSNRAWNRADRAQHPEKGAARQQARRAKVRGVFVEVVTVVVLLQRDRARCGLCQTRVARRDASIDHIIPLSRGGEHSYRNTQLAHLKCNMLKGAREIGQLRLIG